LILTWVLAAKRSFSNVCVPKPELGNENSPPELGNEWGESVEWVVFIFSVTSMSA